MRTILLIRHAKSEGNRFDRHLFGVKGAPLDKTGISQAEKLHSKLADTKTDFTQTVAVSEMIRTQQTAETAGFLKTRSYKLLNEVHHGLSKDQLKVLLAEKRVPEQAITAAKKLLSNPPAEAVWFTHGMLIAAIAEVLNIPKSELYIPDMATISEITLS